MTRHILIAASALLLILQPAAWAANPSGILIIRTTDKSSEAVVAAIKAYVEESKWIYLGDNKVKKGQVTLVKICIPEVGRMVWPIGQQLTRGRPDGLADRPAAERAAALR